MKDTTILIIACCLFSFVIGVYTTILVEKDRGCTVSFSKDNVTHVMTGFK